MVWQRMDSWCQFFSPRKIVSSSEHTNDLVPLRSGGRLYMRDDRYDNVTAGRCRALADRYKTEAKELGISKKRASVLMNISRTYSGLASQLEILAGDTGET